jgi:Tol biopolymer transport system component
MSSRLAISLFLFVAGSSSWGATRPATAAAQTLGSLRICQPDAAYLGGKALLYASDRDGDMDLFIMYPDGCRQEQLSNNEMYDGSPVWSKDRTQIAFTTNRHSTPASLNFDIYVMNADGTGQHRLTYNAATDWQPAWSPNGRILFVTTRAGNADIYSMYDDGTGQTPIASGPWEDYHPTVSPDGSKVAFTSNRDGNEEIYVMNADGTGQVRRTNFAASDDSPTWSPDGKQIAFTRVLAGNNYEIFVMDRDGTNARRITTNPGMDSDATWSPDGTRLAFTSCDFQTCNIYTIRLDGTARIRLTSKAFNGMVDWGRTVFPILEP